MVGWRHRFSRHKLGQTSGNSEEQGSLVHCSPWGCEESDIAWQLNNNRFVIQAHHLHVSFTHAYVQ